MTAVQPKTNKAYDLLSSNQSEIVSKRLAEFTRENLFIGLPAIVTKTSEYESRQVIDVQLVVADQWIDGRVLSPLQIKSVFVKLLHGNGCTIKVPIAVGDPIELRWPHRSLNSWLDGDGGIIQQPIDYVATARDCYAVPGFGTRKVNQSPSATDLVIDTPKASIRFEQDGTVTTTAAGKVITITDDNVEITSQKDIDITVSGSASISAPGGCTITGDTTINGNTSIAGDLTVSGSATAETVTGNTEVTAGGKDLAVHTHGFVKAGLDTSGPNN